VIRLEAGEAGEREDTMSETLTAPRTLDALFKRAERSRAEAERWFRFVQRFDESRRTGRDLALTRIELSMPRDPEPVEEA
jgi:hypothetical protein